MRALLSLTSEKPSGLRAATQPGPSRGLTSHDFRQPPSRYKMNRKYLCEPEAPNDHQTRHPSTSNTAEKRSKMHTSTIIAALVTFAAGPAAAEHLGNSSLSPLPLHPPKLNAAYVPDFEAACKKYEPTEDRCVVIAATGFEPEWDPAVETKPEDSYEHMAVVSNQGCKNFYAKPWKPMNPCFEVKFNSTAFDITAKVRWIWRENIEKLRFQVNGIKAKDVQCGKNDKFEGHNPDLDNASYRVCHFPCSRD